MRALIDAKCDVDVTNKVKATPLHAVVQNNNAEAAELLLAHGADVNIKTTEQNSMVHLAIYNGSHEMLKLLLKYNPKFETHSAKNALIHPVAIAAFLGEFGMLHDLVSYLVQTMLLYDCLVISHACARRYARGSK